MKPGIHLRCAVADDFDVLLPYALAAHSRSVLSSIPMVETALRRSFVTAIAFDDGLANVVERNGEVIGGMVAFVAENHFGIRCALDLFTYAAGGTNLLLVEFKRWAGSRDAAMIQITDLSGNARYQKLIEHNGLIQSGFNYSGVL